jgi:large subunit ribosomal protein L30
MEKKIMSKEKAEKAAVVGANASANTNANTLKEKKKKASIPSIPSAPTAPKAKPKLALVLVRGFIMTKNDIIATLFNLRLRRKHACVVLEDTLSNRASAMKCKDYIAFGEISDETHKILLEKRGKKDSEGKLKKFFSLSPPRGGFERKGIKTPFNSGGALGYRGAKINDLIKKMI